MQQTKCAASEAVRNTVRKKILTPKKAVVPRSQTQPHSLPGTFVHFIALALVLLLRIVASLKSFPYKLPPTCILTAPFQVVGINSLHPYCYRQ